MLLYKYAGSASSFNLGGYAMQSYVSGRLRSVMSFGVTALLAITVFVLATNDSATPGGAQPLAGVAVGNNKIFVPPMVSPDLPRMIEVTTKTVYEGGPIAYVDFSADPNFGDCVVIWYPEGHFGHCADASDWQTMFIRMVPVGTDFWLISHEWDTTFAPNNWR